MGKGIASKCLKAVIKYVHNLKKQVEKLTSGYYKLNKASAKVLEKIISKLRVLEKEKLLAGKRVDYVEVGLIKNENLS